MKRKLNAKKLPPLFAGMGLCSLLARIALFILGGDEKGLLIPGHPLDLLSWALAAAAMVLIAAAVPGLGGSKKYADNFGPSAAAAIGCFMLAGGIAATAIQDWSLWAPRLEQVRNLCGLLAVPALVVLGLHRRKGAQPFFLLHGTVCLYLILYAVSHYQYWSSHPQLQDWFFSMAASILLTLFSYYQTAFDVSMGSRRMQLGTGLAAAFFCIAAMADGKDLLLYLGGGAWALTNLCSLTPVPRRRRNPLTEVPREEEK